MKAVPAFEGYVKYGEWLPIWVELENTGRDINGEVRIQITGTSGVTSFVSPVSLPSGSHKLFPIYTLPNNFSSEVTIALVSQGTTLTSVKAKVHPQPNISFFIGLVAPERGALSLLNGLVLPDQNRPRVMANVSLSELPERAEALRSFDVLVINNLDTSKLTPAQQAALQSWVQSGGRLVLGGGTNAAQTFSGLPESIKPVTLQGSVEIGPESLKELASFASTGAIQAPGPFIAAVGQPKSASILVGNEALPLLLERSLGNGHVDFSALDLAIAPFDGWSGTVDFWKMLLSPGSAFPQNLPFDMSARQMRANNLSYALSNMPALDLPSVQELSILLGIYILLVGPANYLVLRYFKRLHLAWVTVPVITVLFTAGSFGIGYALRGTDLILNRIALIEPGPGGDAVVTSYMGLFSPRQQSYEITVQGEGLVSPMGSYDQNQWGPGGQPVTGGETVFIQGQPSTIKGLTVNQFSLQSFMSEETWKSFGQVSGNLTIESDALKGTVRNDTSVTLKDVVVIFENARFQRLGDLAPGQEANVDLGLANMGMERMGPPVSYRLFQEQYSMSGQPLPRDVDLKTNILTNVLDNNFASGKMMAVSSFAPGGGSVEKSSPIMVIAWLDQAPPNVEVRNNRLTQTTTALLYAPISYHMPESGAVSLPVGMIPGNLTKTPPNGGSCGPWGLASINMAQGEAEFEFNLPADVLKAKITDLKVNIRQDQGTGDWTLPQIALWDWKSEQWTVIQAPIQGTNVIKDPANLINEGGLVRLKLNSNSAMFMCTYIDLGLEANLDQGSGGQP